jgi:NADP-dependent 3-hydroxy acid dehydrogenase YdfG
MSDYIRGKTILVTGAGSGFGRLISQKAAAQGARVICADIAADAAETVVSGIRASGGDAWAIAVDVARIEDMRAVVALAVEVTGRVDVLVNNAGIMPLAFIADHDRALDSWNRCIDINFKGMMNGVVAAYDQMMAQGDGHVVNMSSIYGNFPVVGAAVYGASKAAVDYFSHSLRQESQGRIRVTVIKPTGVPTTGIGSAVVNTKAALGILGQNAGRFGELVQQMGSGTVPQEAADPESISYNMLAAEHIADAVLYAINQPLGVSVSDLTVRASGDLYVL